MSLWSAWASRLMVGAVTALRGTVGDIIVRVYWSDHLSVFDMDSSLGSETPPLFYAPPAPSKSYHYTHPYLPVLLDLLSLNTYSALLCELCSLHSFFLVYKTLRNDKFRFVETLLFWFVCRSKSMWLKSFSHVLGLAINFQIRILLKTKQRYIIKQNIFFHSGHI